MAESEQNWRSQVPRNERVRVLHHILGKIREIYSATPENVLKEKIRRLESSSYSSATSHTDYLQKIANTIEQIQKHSKQAQARQAFANFAQGNVAHQQTQAALRQQIRQQQHEALLRRTQLVDPRQLQQYQAQQNQLQQQAKQQVPNRNSSTAANRPHGSASGPKASSQNVQGGKPAQTAAQNPSLANRGKVPTATADNATGLNTEDYQRRLQATGNQAALNSALAQNLGNGAGHPDEYLMALARAQQLPNGSQPQAHVQVQSSQQMQNPNQAQGQFPPGSIMSNVLSPHQQLLQQQEATHRNSAGVSDRRVSQAMLQQRMNRAGTVMHEGMNVDPQKRVDNGYAATVAAIAKAAAALGLNYSPEQLRRLSPAQLQQVAHLIRQNSRRLSGAATQGTIPVNQQVRRNDAQISTNPHISTGMGSNVANWMSHGGNVPQGGRSQVGVGQAPAQSQTMPLDTPKQALQKGPSPRVSTGASSGRSDPNSLPANPSAVTMPQMNEILAQQVLKADNSRNSTQDEKTAQALQDASGVRSSQAARAAPSAHLDAGGAATGVPRSSRAPSAQRTATAGNASEKEIWAKLEYMQRKYFENLKAVIPFILNLQKAHTPERRKLFMEHLKNAVSILSTQRASPAAKRLTMELLNRAEDFIQRVMYVPARYLKQKNGQLGPAQAGANPEDYASQVPVGGSRRSEIPPQAASRLPTAEAMHHVKPDTTFSQGLTSEQLNARRQQNALRQKQIEQQRLQQLFHLQQIQNTGYAQGAQSDGVRADPSKAAAKPTARPHQPRRGTETVRAPGLPTPRAVSGMMSGQQQLQHTRAHGQGQMMDAAQQQAQAIVNAQAAAARASLESQARKAQPDAQASGKVQVKSQASLYPTEDQASRIQRLATQHAMQSQAPNLRLNSQGLAASSVNQQMSQRGGSNAPGTAVPAVPATMPSAAPAKRPELTIQQRMQRVDAHVKEACAQARKLEAMREAEIERDKNERIQTTLAALRNTSSATSGDGDEARGTKRHASLVDVDNVGPKEGVIKPKTVFECSSEAGLRLAKRPKNEAAGLRSLRDAVEADCKAAKERNPLLLVEIIEEFGLPVVTCLLRIPEIRLPKLVLRVQRGYPRKGGATYGFERPPMGWVGVLEDIRTRFKRGLATAPTASIGVATFLHAWATAADTVINGSCLSESR